MFSSADAYRQLTKLREQEAETFQLTFAPEPKPKQSAANMQKTANEYTLFAPNTRWEEETALNHLDEDASIHKLQAEIVRQLTSDDSEDNMLAKFATMDIHLLRAVAKLCNADINLTFTKDVVSTELIKTVINVLQSNEVTPAEQALGTFSRRKLKQLDRWNKSTVYTCLEHW